jgi:hypothetical protein
MGPYIGSTMCRFDRRSGISRATVALSILYLGLMITAMVAVFPERIQKIRTNNDLSTFMRFTGPAFLAIRTAQLHPIAGVGIGGKEEILDELYFIWMRSNINEKHLLKTIDSQFGNAFCEYWICTGVGLGLTAGAFLLRAVFLMIPNTTLARTATIFFIFTQFNLDSGIPSFRIWSSLGVFLAVLYASDATD